MVAREDRNDMNVVFVMEDPLWKKNSGPVATGRDRWHQRDITQRGQVPLLLYNALTLEKCSRTPPR